MAEMSGFWRLGRPWHQRSVSEAGTQEKVLVRPASMPGICGIPDINLAASQWVSTAAFDPLRTLDA